MKTFAVLRGGLVWGALGFTFSMFVAGCGGVVVTHEDGDPGPGSGGSGASTPGTGAAVSSGATSSGGGSTGKGGGAGVVGTGGGQAGTVGKGGTAGKSGAGGVVGAGGGKAGGAGTSAGGGAGKGGGAGTISKGGAGGVSQGGSAGVISVGGSAGACAGIACAPPIMCPVGSSPYVPPGACCPVCGLNCSLVDCADKPCPVGSMPVRLPGQCCATSCTPVVTPDAGQTCDQQGYVSFHNALETKYGTLPCSVDTECAVVVTTQCGVADCGAAIPSQMVMSYVGNLQSFAASSCNNCPPTSPCSTFASVMCVHGLCELVYPPTGR